MVNFKKFNLNDYKDYLIVTDENLSGLYGIAGDNVYLLPQGEQAKSFCYVEKLCEWFLSKNLERQGRIVAVGGGSVSDVVGFAASVYKRGVNLTVVPTTLVAQIDAAIGGKTAINLGTVKNAVGSFYNADVNIDTDFLKTLSKRQLTDGQGELLKYRMLSAEIDNACGKDMLDLIKACVSYKTELCNADMYDLGIRRKLNFGHTVGHAMELSLNLTHGEAVANGLYYETLLAYKLKLCTKNYLDKWQREILTRFTVYPLTDEILNLTSNDKKNTDGNISFVLPDKFETVCLPLDTVKSLL